MSKVNRNFKAGVFSHLFGDEENERGLYDAFSPVKQSENAEVVDLTLEDILYMDRINDLAFSVGGTLVCFFEAQSTINDNIAVRHLMYCGRVYEKMVDNKSLYSSQRVAIATPEFYVLYTGIAQFPEKKVYRLSDSFAFAPCGDIPLELVVTAYNINKGYNEDLVKKNDILYGYVVFIATVRENERQGMNREKAVREAIRECIKLGYLVEYLSKHGSEVVNFICQEWNWDDALAVREQESRDLEAKKWMSLVAEKDAALADRDVTLVKNAVDLADKDAALADKDATIADKDAALADKDATIADKDAEIAALNKKLNAV